MVQEKVRAKLVGGGSEDEGELVLAEWGSSKTSAAAALPGGADSPAESSRAATVRIGGASTNFSTQRRGLYLLRETGDGIANIFRLQSASGRALLALQTRTSWLLSSAVWSPPRAVTRSFPGKHYGDQVPTNPKRARLAKNDHTSRLCSAPPGLAHQVLMRFNPTIFPGVVKKPDYSHESNIKEELSLPPSNRIRPHLIL